MEILKWVGSFAIAILAGASLVIQSSLNAQVRSVWGSPAWAALISYLGGSIVMILVLLIIRPAVPDFEVLQRARWVTYLGGFFGACYVVSLIVIIPVLGNATSFSLLVAGQMVCALVLDHFALLGAAESSMDPKKMMGVVLLSAGVYFIRV